MKDNKRYHWQAIVLLGVMMLSLLIASPALADEGTPPPAATEETAPVADSGGEESAPVEEASESAPSEESAPVEEASSTSETEADESLAEVLDQVPADTSIIVVDENGEALPLASEAAEEAIITKDPIWCPAGVLPKPGIGGCSTSFSSLSALVGGFIPPAKNGVIWIEVGTDTGAEVVIDGTVWTSAANYSLTLQGGWIGPAGQPVGSMAIVGTTEFDTAISIINWNGAVTINDISFNGANNTAYPTTGSLFVQTKKNIVLSNVMSINSAGAGNDGAYLDNSSSTTQATITVKNSTFNSNILRGITIASGGAVTLTNVTAHFNSSYGVYIQNNTDSTASVVSVTKGFFNQNGNDGLHILSNGAVKLSQISASSNTSGGDGVDVNNTFASTPQAVTVSGFLSANYNQGYGLYITSKGAVTLTNITTDFNSSGGTYIDNDSAPKPLAVTINGVNSMSNNPGGVGSSGLNIISLGAVTLNNITAEYNSYYGVVIDNSSSSVPSAVNIKGTNLFNGNGYQGLNVYTNGAINLYNISANANAYAYNSVGVVLANDINAAKPQNVNLFGVNTMNNNGEGGLIIYSYGTVTLNNITASFNGFSSSDSFGDGVFIGNYGGTLARPVILKGVNTFYGNDGNGLAIFSLGAVSVSNVTANTNGQSGVHINNATSFFQSPVTITGYGVFNDNTKNGLHIISNGTVNTTNLSAMLNSDNGVVINTIGLTKVQAVNMKGNNTFIGNGTAMYEAGLIVNADGNITVSNLTASLNFEQGAILNNFINWSTNHFAKPGSVTITGFGNFYNNGNSGLYIYTQANVTISNVISDRNGWDGIGIDALGKVSLTCILATNNDAGLWMYSQASNLTIKGLSAVGNFTQNEFLDYVNLVRSRCP